MGRTSGFLAGFALTVLHNAVSSSASHPGSVPQHSSSCLAASRTHTTRDSAPATDSRRSLSRVPPPGNRWLSRALASRGGADSPSKEGGGEAEKLPGMLSEIEIAVSSFADIAGENLLTVDNAKKGTTKEVGYK